jgi:hypothetical protein
MAHANGSVNVDSNLLVASAGQPGTIIVLVHFGAGAYLSPRNLQMLRQLGASQVQWSILGTQPSQSLQRSFVLRLIQHERVETAKDAFVSERLTDCNANFAESSGLAPNSSQVSMPATPDEADAAQKARAASGWSYLFVRTQGTTMVDSYLGGCAAQRWAGMVQTRLGTSSAACPDSAFKQQPCNERQCPQDCVMGAWSDWDECSTKCGGGQQRQKREILRSPAYGGAPCNETLIVQSCNMHRCPIDCDVSEWSLWSSCSRFCGGGKQSRTRTIHRRANYGGNDCPSQLVQEVDCNTEPCRVEPPTPAPSTPPPACEEELPWFVVEGTMSRYLRFDTTRLSSRRFSIAFEARTCSDARLVFMTRQNERVTNGAYEVVIGGVENTQSMIRVGTQSMPLASVQHNPHAKTCDEFRPFWVWRRGGDSFSMR